LSTIILIIIIITIAKYAALDGRYMFVPIAFENLGVPNASAKLLFTHLGRRLSEKS